MAKRALVAIGMLLLGAAVVGIVGVVSGLGATGSARGSNCPADPPRVIRDSFPEPPVRRSKNGKLVTRLRATNSSVRIAGRKYVTQNYEGSVPGPTLVLCPGDRLRVRLENGLIDPTLPQQPTFDQHGDPFQDAIRPITSPAAQPTNLHTHGFHVSPRANHDNVFVNINPGKSFTYEYDIPKNHPPGLYWYHPHRHGYVEGQIFRGMFGAIVIQGGLDEIPALRDVPVRNMVIHYTQLDPKSGRVVKVEDSNDDDSRLYVNGAYRPKVPIRPGEVQRWRILNAVDNPMVKLRLEGAAFTLLANDGNTIDRATRVKDLLIGAGERREVLVRGAPAGRYELRSLSFRQYQGSPAGGNGHDLPVATVVSSGRRVSRKQRVGLKLSGEQDLRGKPISSRHKIVFSEAPQPNGQTAFLLNGMVFDPRRTDQRMRLGKVAEWTIVNRSDEWHSFHIHVNDFQVTKVSGKAPPRVSDGKVRDVGGGDVDPEDTAKLPPRKTVKFLTRPTDFTGKFVFHCHVAFHEDHGMMGTVEVVR